MCWETLLYHAFGIGDLKRAVWLLPLGGCTEETRMSEATVAGQKSHCEGMESTGLT